MADDLEGALRTLSRQLDVPPAPDVTAAVRARLDHTPAPRPRPALRYAFAVLIVLLSLVIVTVTVPPVRAAVLDFFRIGGVEVHQGGAPTAPAGEPGAPIGQRDVADLAEAERLTGLRVRAPRQLGAPNRIVVTDDRVVSLRWRDPVARFEAFDGRLMPLFRKYLRVETATMVDVGGVIGWYAPGPHELIYVDQSGRERHETARLAASTLIWERDGVTYRLEAALPKDRLVAVATSATGP